MRLRQAGATFVKRLFRSFGLDVRGLQYAPGTTMSDCLEVARAKGLTPQTVIDVGVAYGTPELYDAFPDAHYLLIEALSEWEPVLRSLGEKLDAEYVVAAATSSPGTVTIRVPEVWAWAGANAEGEARDVPGTTIDSEIARRGLSGPFLLKVDVEGAEVSVLAGAKETLRNADMVIVETGFATTLPEVMSLMRESGFVPHDLFGLAYSNSGHVLQQADFAFVPEDSALRAAEYRLTQQSVNGFIKDQLAATEDSSSRHSSE
jgi:FkbM family methyltransferase